MARITFRTGAPLLGADLEAAFVSGEMAVAQRYRDMGDWDADTMYAPRDVVFYTAAYWVCLVATSTTAPVAGTTWRQFGGGGGGIIADGSVTDAKIADGVDAAKIGTGAVSNTEFATLDGVTGPIQAQLDALPTVSEVTTLATAAVATSFQAGTNITLNPDPGTGKTVIAAIGDISSSLSRATASATTGAIGNGATDAGQTIALGRCAWVMRVATSQAAWVRIYATAAAQALDAGRAMSSYPAAGSGIVLDVVTTAGNLSIDLAPMAQASNMETAPSPNYHLSICNLSGSNQTITVTFTKVTIEL